MFFFSELFESKMNSNSIITLLVLTISVRPSTSEQSLEAVKEVCNLDLLIQLEDNKIHYLLFTYFKKGNENGNEETSGTDERGLRATYGNHIRSK